MGIFPRCVSGFIFVSIWFYGYPLVGDADHVTELLKNLSDAGVDGFLLTWLDYEGGLARFGRELLPRLERAGLRAPFAEEV